MYVYYTNACHECKCVTYIYIHVLCAHVCMLKMCVCVMGLCVVHMHVLYVHRYECCLYYVLREAPEEI